MAIIQGGNAPIVLELTNYTSGTVTGASAVLSKDGKAIKTWTEEEIQSIGTLVSLPLTQEETMNFPSGICMIEFKYAILGNVYFSEQKAVVVSARVDKTILS